MRIVAKQNRKPRLHVVLEPISREEDRAMRRAAYRDRDLVTAKLHARRTPSGKVYHRYDRYDED